MCYFMDNQKLVEIENEEAVGGVGKVAVRATMEEVTKNSSALPDVGALVEGRVIAKEKMSLYVEIIPFGTGIIFGREYLNARDVIKKVNIGDLVTAKVVALEGEEGYFELSLKEAKQALVWSDAEKAIKSKAVFDVMVKDANKGGLIMEWQGIDGFIPASQLKADHYPRVTDGDKDKIADELKKLVGKMLSVSIITADPRENKLIFSEKNQDNKAKKTLIEKYSLGDIVDGEVTGAVDFGIFIKVEDGLEGLVHISEIDWSLVENPRDVFKVGEKVKAKIIEIKDDKISLSIKALKTNPWSEAEKKYKRGEIVKGVVIKYNKHGALISIEEGVAGLVHISEFKTEEELRKTLELGKTYTFTINLFEPRNQKMTLSFGAITLPEVGEKKEEGK
ncbi:MAG: RNA binding S1 domain protein [Parcubacteria group bacterium GW2011_GWC1_43_11b]|nr:MAG: RNA binding S1 domain protein [Parcubacteria group bacterium GW2011_GWC1_43_11b]KKT09885.1 MAG: RNA binding S1 domain protein [Parcubacteria group bacterium GW2011_GWA1_43_21]